MRHSSVLLSSNQCALPGILGGLGPLAHIEFEQRLLDKSVAQGASKDQEHPVWLLINAAATPDRTQSLQGLTPNCTTWLREYSQLLQRMGADFLIVTCNTAHAFHGQIQPDLAIPWLHMMKSVARFIKREKPSVQKVGVMATTGTLQAQLYATSLTQLGLLPISPALDSDIQHEIMQSIYDPVWGIKASGATVSPMALATLGNAMDWFKHQGAEVVIAGCTELSVGLARLDQVVLNWVDPLDVMAELAIGLAFGESLLIHPKKRPSPAFIVTHPEGSNLDLQV